MIEKLAKNPKVTFWMLVALVVIVVAFIWDERKGKKDMFGLLKNSSTTTV